MLSQFLNSRTIAVRQRAWDKAQAIRIAGELLVKQKLIDEKYIDEMVQAVEKLGPYIVLSPGIAFAHARPSQFVQRDCVSLVTLDPPVAFGHPRNDPVSVLFVLAARQANQHLSVMRDLAKLIIRPDFLPAMAQAGSEEELLKYLRSVDAQS